MEITGKVVSILEPQRFTSKKDGSEIMKNFFVLETQGQYPKKIAFSVLGEDKFKTMGLVVGGVYNVSFDIESREWQGKWFSDVSAWRAMRTDGQAVSQAPTQESPVHNAQPAPAPTTNTKDGGVSSPNDLPF